MSYQTHVGLRISTQAGAVPTAKQIGEGELAFNLADRKIYTRFGDAVDDITDHYTRAETDQVAQDLSDRLDDMAIGDIAGLFTALASKVNKVEGKGLSSNDYTDSARNTLAATDQLARDLSARLDDLAIGDIAGLFAALASKVNKEEGKGLSSNDYTDSARNTLAATDQLARDLSTRLDELGIGDIDGLFTALASKVNKEEGKGLSSNDYTDSDQAKVAAVGTMANRAVYISSEPPDDAVGNDGDVWLQHWS